MDLIKHITDGNRAKEWNNVVVHPLQTWEWGEIRQKNVNQILRIAIVDNKDRIKQAFLFTVHNVFLNKLVINYAKGIFVPENILTYLKKYYKNTAIFVKLEPEVYLEEAGKYKVPLIKNKWHRGGLDYYLSKSTIFAKHTFILNLIFSEDKLLAGLKSKTRYNINLAKKKGAMVVDESKNEKGFDIFFELYLQTIKRQNYLGHSKSYHKSVWQVMSKAGYGKILVAYYNRIPVSSYMLFMFKDTAYYLYGGSSHLYKEVMASNLLMWESISIAKKLGYKYFDLWGALEKNYDSNHSWAGFHRFKQGYNGTHMSYLPTIDVVFQKYWYFLFSFVWPIRIKLLELRNRYL